MRDSSFESKVIEHCAPTLAGMKTANLFSCFFNEKQMVLKELNRINAMLNVCGVYVEALLWKDRSVLIYVYRPRYLQLELKQYDTKELLACYGYTSYEVESCISRLKERLCQYECFPHEIGVFLGYPLEDVKGFIENEGRNCKTCGVWKVYCNEGEKQRLFEKFRKCTEVYKRVFGEGRKLSQMTVST